MKADDLAEALYDYAVSQPEGFTNVDFMAEHNVTLDEFNRAVNKLRSILATDTITLICDPGDARSPWIYRLVGQVDEGSPWVQNRLRDAESRFTTMSHVAATLVNATDGRSLDGRRARLMQKALTRLKEDLDEIAVEVNGWPA